VAGATCVFPEVSRALTSEGAQEPRRNAPVTGQLLEVHDMKIDLIGMILNHAGREPFEGIIIDDDGNELDATRSLDAMIMEYAKVRGGGQSDIVVVSKAVTD
jgi:hypothetical protein